MAVHNPKGPDRVKFIADLLGEGISQAEIGRRLGISRARVGQIVMANGLRSATRRVQGSLSERQVRVLKFIREFSNRNSYPPTYREIAGSLRHIHLGGGRQHKDSGGKGLRLPRAGHRTEYSPDQSLIHVNHSCRFLLPHH